MQSIASEGRNTSRRTIHSIAHAFEQLASLGLDDLTLLLVAAVQSQVHKLSWILFHKLNLRLPRLHEVKADREHDRRLLLDEDVDIVWLGNKDADDLKKLNHEVHYDLVVH